MTAQILDMTYARAPACLSTSEWRSIYERDPEVLPECCEFLDKLHEASKLVAEKGFSDPRVCKAYLYAWIDAHQNHPDLSRNVDLFRWIASEARAALREVWTTS